METRIDCIVVCFVQSECYRESVQRSNEKSKQGGEHRIRLIQSFISRKDIRKVLGH